MRRKKKDTLENFTSLGPTARARLAAPEAGALPNTRKAVASAGPWEFSGARVDVAPSRTSQVSKTLQWVGAFVVIEQVALGWSPSADRFTWAMENFPVWIGFIAIAATYRRFPLSNLCLVLLALHSLVLAVGGHYTYAKVPLGDWARDAFHLSRNHYDRLGHFTQGFVPAILIREVLVRKLTLRGFGLAVLTVASCLAFSAFYEFIEWWTALLTGEGATAFLGTQGDVWDTQWDMFLAFVGAIVSLITLSRAHDNSMQKLPTEQGHAQPDGTR